MEHISTEITRTGHRRTGKMFTKTDQPATPNLWYTKLQPYKSEDVNREEKCNSQLLLQLVGLHKRGPWQDFRQLPAEYDGKIHPLYMLYKVVT